jgi:tetratricopeptide (TPR) repeat protein
MRHHCLTVGFLVFLHFYQVASASDVTKTADSLISQRKYATAFNLLHETPASNDERSVVFKKIDIALEYFVLSIGHAIFSFKDLTPGETIEELRGKEGSYSSFYFPVDSVLERLISRYPKDGKVYRYLGDFYDDVTHRYSGRWSISDDSLASLIYRNYKIARELKAVSYNSLHRLGVISLHKGEFALAESCFKEATTLRPQEADPYYNLAYLYTQKKRTKQAIASGLKAFDLYKDPQLRSDAGRLVASCYFNLREYQSGLKYLAMVDSFDPANAYVYRSILYAHLKLDHADSAFQATRRLFALDPTNPSVTQAIMTDYSEAGKSSQVPTVFRRLIPEYSRNDTASGNLYFHLALSQYEGSQGEAAMKSLDSCETRFNRCYSNDHQVFKAIKSLREAN